MKTDLERILAFIFLGLPPGLLGLLLVAGPGCSTLPEVKRASSSQSLPPSSITYSLPRTIVAVTIPVTQVQRGMSEFSAQLNRSKKLRQALVKELLSRGLDPGELRFQLQTDPRDLKATFDDRFSIGWDKIAVSTFAEADPLNTFSVNLKAYALEDVKFDFAFGKDGILKSSTLSSTNQTIPWILKIAEVALAVSAVPKSSREGGDTPPKIDPEIIRLAPEMAAVLELLDLVISLETTLTQSAAKSGGGLSADGFERTLARLEERKAQLIARLLGRKREIVANVTLVHVPLQPRQGTSAPKERPPLFKFQPSLGINYLTPERNPLPLPNYYGKPPQPVGRLEGYDKPPPDTPVDAFIEVYLSQSPVPILREIPDIGGLVYRQPARSTVDVIGETEVSGAKVPKTHIRQEVIIAQWGELRQLPRKLGGISSALAVTLDPETGALLTLSTSKTALPPSAIDAAAKNYIAAESKTPVDEELKAANRLRDLKKAEYEARDYEDKLKKLPKDSNP